MISLGLPATSASKAGCGWLGVSAGAVVTLPPGLIAFERVRYHAVIRIVYYQLVINSPRATLEGILPEYVCLRCFYEWDSALGREGIRCPNCHTRQGVSAARFNRAVEAAERALSGFPIPPNPADVLSGVSNLLETINAALAQEFPDPLLPPRVAVEVWNRAVARIHRRRQQTDS